MSLFGAVTEKEISQRQTKNVAEMYFRFTTKKFSTEARFNNVDTRITGLRNVEAIT